MQDLYSKPVLKKFTVRGELKIWLGPHDTTYVQIGEGARKRYSIKDLAARGIVEIKPKGAIQFNPDLVEDLYKLTREQEERAHLASEIREALNVEIEAKNEQEMAARKDELLKYLSGKDGKRWIMRQ